MENVELYRIGPIAKGNHRNFALVERDGKHAHILYYQYKGGAIYELIESIACCSEEAESIVESLSESE